MTRPYAASAKCRFLSYRYCSNVITHITGSTEAVQACSTFVRERAPLCICAEPCLCVWRHSRCVHYACTHCNIPYSIAIVNSAYSTVQCACIDISLKMREDISRGSRSGISTDVIHLTYALSVTVPLCTVAVRFLILHRQP